MAVSTSINRFTKNCHHSKQSGSLTTLVVEKQINFYIKNEQKRLESSEKVQQDRKSLSVVQNTKGIYECRGRIQGIYPIYLPKESLLTEKIVWVAHKKTIHRRFAITISNIRTYYWIPSLKKVTKLTIKKIL